jgi:predicted S18 family serine protease
VKSTVKQLLPVLFVLAIMAAPAEAGPIKKEPVWREQLIRILGTTMSFHRDPVGVVGEIEVAWEQRGDEGGMEITFESEPGRFSPVSQAAVLEAIVRTARAARLQTDSWTVSLAVRSPDTTIYGESLSAMVGLSVVALAKGHFIPPDRVITGTITSDGRIGTVGGVPLKVKAAQIEHLQRVLVPEEKDTVDGDWTTPFLMQISPVGSIGVAYQALTDRPLQETDIGMTESMTE